MFDLDRRRFAATLLAAAAVPRGVRAQGLSLDDLLALEGLGRRAITPDGRWLLLEHRGPYASAVRFDFDRLNDLMRTRILRLDLARTTPPLDLTRADGVHGYALGELAPGGRHALLYRVGPDGFECGLADIAAGAVRWTGVFGDWFDVARSAQWRSPEELLVISPPAGCPPMLLRQLRPQAALPERWARSARGEAAVTAIGAGRYRGETPRDPPKTLIGLPIDGGPPTTLAEGDFADLEISPDGGCVALAAFGDHLPLSEAHEIQGDYGMAVRVRSLRLLDLARGQVSAPAPDLDLIGQPLSWSLSGARLLVYGREPGTPWSRGRLKVLERASGRMSDATPPELEPLVLSRPELVRAGWMGETPLVYARERGRQRADWWRLGADPRPLTRDLAEVPADGVAADPHGLNLISSERLVRLTATGAVRVLAAPVRQVTPFREGLLPRTGWTFAAQGVIAATSASPQLRTVTLQGERPQTLPRPAAGEVLLVAPGRGTLVRRRQGGGEQLAWVDAQGRERDLFGLNPRLATRRLPRVHAVDHVEDGQALTSWLVLPEPTPVGRAPVVVWPYPGLVLGAPPATLHPLTNPGLEPVFLLASRGYAVLLPSLPDKAGPPPATGLAQRILAVVDACGRDPAVRDRLDLGRLGVWGHSFGGYAAVAVIGQTDRFAAAVSTAGITDLFSKWGEIGPMRRIWPQDGLYNPGWTEDLQPRMGGPPWTDPSRYVEGSPLFGLAHGKTPLLLFHGDQDAIPLPQSEAAFVALQRRNADAMLVTYWGEGHVIRSPGNMRDYYGRALAWFDTHLRNTAATNVASVR